MYAMFVGAGAFNQPIGTWNTGSVTDMSYMWQGAQSFNQAIGTWDTSKVTTMYAMFWGASAFNQPIGTWNTGSVEDMSWMFLDATSFNQPIESWNVSRVTSFWKMFKGASSFDQQLDNWNTSNVLDMSSLFENIGPPVGFASSASTSARWPLAASEVGAALHGIENWDVSKVTSMSDMFSGSSLPTASYDLLLQSWSTQSLRRGVRFNAGASTYSQSGASARAEIVSRFGWTIVDAGPAADGTTSIPAAPTSAVASVSNNSVSVTWNAPTITGGSEIESYLVTSKPGSRSCTTSSVLMASPVTSCIVSGLTPGVSYTFSVRATNDIGASGPSLPSNSVVAPGRAAPSEPRNVTAIAGRRLAVVSWLAPTSTGGRRITRYTVTSNPNTRTCTTTGALTCNVTGLTPGVAYTFTVTATSSNGTSLASDPSAPVTVTSASSPGAVRNLRASRLVQGLTITWSTPASDGGATIVGYDYRVGSGPWVRTTARTVTLRSLTSGSDVTVSVRAVNSAGSGISSSITARPR